MPAATPWPNRPRLRQLILVVCLALPGVVAGACSRTESGGGVRPGEVDPDRILVFKNQTFEEINAGYGAALQVSANLESGALAYVSKIEPQGLLQLREWTLAGDAVKFSDVKTIASGVGDNAVMIGETGNRFILGSEKRSEIERALVVYVERNDWAGVDLDIEGDVGAFLAVTADSSGVLHVAYVERALGQVRYLAWLDGVFLVTPERIDEGFEEGQIGPGGEIDQGVAIAINAAGEPIVTYYDATNGQLRLARKSLASNTWVIEVIGNLRERELLSPNSAGVAQTINSFVPRKNQMILYINGNAAAADSFELNSNQEVRIVGFDANNEYLLDYVQPASPDYGSWSSIAIKSDGTVVVSFFDFRGGALFLAQNSNVGVSLKWDLSLVDNQGIVGDFNRLALLPIYDEAGVFRGEEPILAYQDVGNGDLKLAFQSNNAWTFSRLDTVGLTGFNPSMVVSPEGYITIAYRALEPDTFLSQLRLIRALPTSR